MNLKNKGLIVITGASRGIGMETALLLAAQGAELFLTYKAKASLSQALELKKKCQDCAATAVEIAPLDVANPIRRQGLIQALTQSGQKLFALINNSAVLMQKTLDKMSEEDITLEMNTNLLGPILLTRGLLPCILSDGFVINLGSDAGIYGRAGLANYCATKGGLMAFTRAMAKEVPHVRFVSVNPGQTATDMSNGQGQSPKAVAQAIVQVLTGGLDATQINVGPVFDEEEIPSAYNYHA